MNKKAKSGLGIGLLVIGLLLVMVPFGESTLIYLGQNFSISTYFDQHGDCPASKCVTDVFDNLSNDADSTTYWQSTASHSPFPMTLTLLLNKEFAVDSITFENHGGASSWWTSFELYGSNIDNNTWTTYTSGTVLGQDSNYTFNFSNDPNLKWLNITGKPGTQQYLIMNEIWINITQSMKSEYPDNNTVIYNLSSNTPLNGTFNDADNVSLYYTNDDGDLIRKNWSAGGDFTYNITGLNNSNSHTWFLNGCKNNNCSHNSTNRTLITNSSQITSLGILDKNKDLMSNSLVKITNPSIITYDNPYNTSFNRFLNNSMETAELQINMTDLNYKYRNNATLYNFSSTSKVWNFTMMRNNLNLYFNSSIHGGALNISYFYAYFNTTERNLTNVTSGNSTGLYSADLPKTKIYFRLNTVNGINWTNYYEFINDGSSVNETIFILPTAEQVFYYRIESESGTYLDNATVTVQQAFTNTSDTRPRLIGQRVTDDDGIAQFYFSTASGVFFTVSRDGYDPKTNFITPSDFNTHNTITTAKVIKLKKTTYYTGNNVWMGVPDRYSNTTRDIPGVVVAYNRDKVEVTTQYRMDNGFGAREVKESLLANRYNFNLSTAEGDYVNGQNITLYLLIDENIVENRTITYYQATKVFDFPGLDKGVLNPMLAIGLVLISTIIGYAVASSSAGFTTFMTGSIFLTLISIDFMWLTVTSILYYIMISIRKVFSE